MGIHARRTSRPATGAVRPQAPRGRADTGRLFTRRILPAAAALALCIVGMLLPATPRPVEAHPLGNFTINRYARLEPVAGAVRIVYALDMAEIPTFQEMSALDRDRDNAVSDAEQAAYLDKRLPELARNLRLTLNGAAVAARPLAGSLTLADGQGGLRVLRLDAEFTADLPDDSGDALVTARFRDQNYENRLGWKEIVITGGGVRETSTGADVSDGLRAYPEDALQSPLDVREARFSFDPAVAGAATTTATEAERAARTLPATEGAGGLFDLSRFADLAATEDLTLTVMLFSLVAAMFWGALHALGPGHGKTVVAAYLVGSRGTARHAIFLGLTVTATHTAGVYLLGLVTLTASHFIVPERLYPILGLVSGLVVVGMGLSLLFNRLGGVRSFRVALARVWQRQPRYALALAEAGGSRYDSATAVAGRRLPSTAVRGGEERGHRAASGPAHRHEPPAGPDAGHTDDEHGGAGERHGHEHGDHQHGHDAAHGDHSHDQGHSHAIPGMDGRPVTWRSLLALGIYGGLIPCPTAIVVLLTSISLDRLGFGMVLVVAFSAGLAAVLTGIGLALVYAGRAMTRLRVPGGIARAVPVLSATAVIVAGILITLRAAGQSGLIG